MQFQITLTSNKGYRPISTIIEAKDAADFLQNIREYRLRAVTRMLAQRHWTDADRVKYGYTTLKQRVYDPARFEQEKPTAMSGSSRSAVGQSPPSPNGTRKPDSSDYW